MNKTVSILVLAYNETANLQAAIKDIIEAADAALDEFEIIIVNDGSDDGTGECAEYLATMIPEIRVLHHDTNRGLRAGYETGLAAARLDRVVWLPGDGEMAAESIRAIFESVGQADISVPYHGTPERRTWFRRLLTFVSTRELNWLLGRDLNYWQGTVCLNTSLARSLPRTESGFFFNAEMLAHALDRGCSYTEIPLVHTDRAHGVSKAVSLRAIWRAQMLILRLWWRLRVKTAAEALGFALEAR